MGHPIYTDQYPIQLTSSHLDKHQPHIHTQPTLLLNSVIPQFLSLWEILVSKQFSLRLLVSSDICSGVRYTECCEGACYNFTKLLHSADEVCMINGHLYLMAWVNTFKVVCEFIICSEHAMSKSNFPPHPFHLLLTLLLCSSF